MSGLRRDLELRQNELRAVSTAREDFFRHSAVGNAAYWTLVDFKGKQSLFELQANLGTLMSRLASLLAVQAWSFATEKLAYSLSNQSSGSLSQALNCCDDDLLRFLLIKVLGPYAKASADMTEGHPAKVDDARVAALRRDLTERRTVWASTKADGRVKAHGSLIASLRKGLKEGVPSTAQAIFYEILKARLFDESLDALLRGGTRRHQRGKTMREVVKPHREIGKFLDLLDDKKDQKWSTSVIWECMLQIDAFATQIEALQQQK